ncbi:metallophosphoesterase family protein [Longispora albida]|uniref:metallophosphoesterase family protein n=1 Tax=Longispora albida TaxID=203523 RepID=UPI0012F9AD6F|nr:metallophosphoesterase [Longispora albida]
MSARIAAVSDLHRGHHSYPESLADEFLRAEDAGADLLLLPGDLTQAGRREQAYSVAADLSRSKLPKVAVLGNHDTNGRSPREIADLTAILTDAGVTILDNGATTLAVRGVTIGIAGGKGFPGGWGPTADSEHAEAAVKIATSLSSLNTDVKIAVFHYAPCVGITVGDRAAEWKLGNRLLGVAADLGGASHVFCGHSHWGTARAVTPGGVTVDNVAWALRRAITIVQVPARAAAFLAA